MRKAALIWRIILSFILILTMLPIGSMTVYAKDDIPSVIITLKPGEGSGSDIVFSSRDDGRMAENQPAAQNGQFWDEGTGGFWFKLPDCPSSFTAPDGMAFAGWGSGLTPGTVYRLESTELTLTAKWLSIDASYDVSMPAVVALNGPGTTDIPFVINRLVLGKIRRSVNHYVDADAFSIQFDGGELKNGTGGSIAFTGGSTAFDSNLEDQQGTLWIHIDPDDFAGAAPGVYTGSLKYEYLWVYNNSQEYVTAGSGNITLTLIIGENDRYSFTLSPGAGSGDPITYSIDDSEIADNRESAANCQFYFEENGSIGFKLDGGYCPASFSSPGGNRVFDGWEGDTGCITLTAANTVRVAKWREVSFSLSLNSFRLTGAGDNRIGFSASTGGLNQSLTFSGGVLSNGTDTIPFSCSDQISISMRERRFQITVTVNPEAYAAAAPGLYYGHLNYYAGRTGDSGFLTLTLEVPVLEKHAVTVNNGIGSGDYAAGARVTITANEPEAGKQFKEWTGAEGLTFKEGSATTATATFTMPSDVVSLTATYEDIPVTTYTVTVNSGSGSGEYAEGASVTITANTPDTGKRFKEWTGADSLTFTVGSAATATATFTMPSEAVTVTASYEDIPVTTYTVTVNSGSGSGEYAEGASVTITANTPDTGKRFKEWTGADGLTFTVGSAATATATFTMPSEAVTVTASYEDIPVTTYSVTVNNGSGSGEYTEGVSVSITADAPEAGKRFKEWTGADDLTFTDGSTTTTAATFIMPAKAVTLTATYEDIPAATYTVTVNSGSGSGEYAEGDRVTITANAPEARKQFTAWTGMDGLSFTAGSTETATATFIMPARDVTVTANYNNRSAQNDPSPYIPASPSVPAEDPVFINPFLDVPEGSYFYDAVMWALQNGITAGTSEDYFSPGMPCSRAQMVTFLWRAAGSPELATTENPFSDLSENDYYYKAVLWAYENGFTMGTGNGAFDPNGTVTRAQCVTFLFRALHGTAAAESIFTDIDPDAYYYEAVLWAAENGITFGTDDGKFSPDDDCLRAQIVTFLYRAYHE